MHTLIAARINTPRNSVTTCRGAGANTHLIDTVPCVSWSRSQGRAADRFTALIADLLPKPRGGAADDNKDKEEKGEKPTTKKSKGATKEADSPDPWTLRLSNHLSDLLKKGNHASRSLLLTDVATGPTC